MLPNPGWCLRLTLGCGVERLRRYESGSRSLETLTHPSPTLIPFSSGERNRRRRRLLQHVFNKVTSTSNDLFHHVAVDVGQAVVAALVFVGEPGVVDAEQVEQRGLQIVDVDRTGRVLVPCG